MTEQTAIGNRVRPLRNVAAMVELVERVEARTDFLSGIATFSGPTGFGKTFAAAHIRRQYNAVHIECCGFWSPKALLSEILRELGETPRGTLYHLFDAARVALTKSGRPLLVDEADKIVSERMIEIIRNLHDKTHATTILIGEENLPQMLKAIPRLDGRIFDWVQAQPADLRDARTLAPFYAAGVEVDDGVLAQIVEASRGQVRRISNNLAFVKEQALIAGRTSMDSATWAGRPFKTAEAPKPRKDIA